MSIFNFFRKPKVVSPSNLDEPNWDGLSPIFEKYKYLLNNIPDPLTSALPTWSKYKDAFDDVIFLNFETISNFMNNEIYKCNLSIKQEFDHNVKTATTTAAFCGWMVGCEWAKNNPNLYSRLKNKSQNEISTNDIPADAMMLLHKAVYFPYWIFASVFTGYYDSRYSQHTRHQKDAHLKDTYQSLLFGELMCFLDGVKSVRFI